MEINNIKPVKVGKDFKSNNTYPTTSNIPKEKIKKNESIKSDTIPTREEAVNYIENTYQPTFIKAPKNLIDSNDVTISKSFSDKLIPALNDINNAFKDKGYEVKIHQGNRSLAEQAEHLKRGESTIPVSLHNVGEAVDISFWKDGKKVMIGNQDSQTKEVKEMLSSIGNKIEELGFTWGGNWKTPYDPWHVQYHKNTKSYLEANKNMIPQFKAFLPDYKERLKNTKDSVDKQKLSELIDYLEKS